MENRIKAIRKSASISQTELATMAGVSPPFLYDLENGRRGARPETMERIAAALGVTVEELKGGDSDTVSDDSASG